MFLCDNQYYTSFQKTLVLLFFVCFIGLLFSFLVLNYKPVFAQVFEFPEADYFEFDDKDSGSEKKERKESIDTYNKKALEFIESGQYENAIEYYEKILAIDSQNQEALTQKQKLENQLHQNKNIQQQDQNTFNDTTEATTSTNNSPIIRYDTQLNTTINIPKKIKLNTVDREGNKLTTTIIALPKYGSLKSDDQTNTGNNNNNNIVTYTPDTNFVGIDSFTLKIDNGKKYYDNRVIVNVRDLTSLENKGNDDIKSSNLTTNEKNTSSSILDKNNNTVNNILPIQNNTATRFISNETSIDKKEILDTTYVFEKKLGNGDNEVGSLSIPLSVAIDNQNFIYASDYGNDNIQKFDSIGNFITSWGESGSGKGQFEYADGIAIDNNDYVYVSDSENNNIQKFDSIGNFITSWGKYGSKDGQFISPEGIAVDNNNDVYVSDNLNDRIQKFDSEGNYISSLGMSGSKEGQIIAPEGIAIDSQNAVYVVDSGNDRIQKFDSNGNFITSWGEHGTGEGQFNYPQGISVDSQNAVYVVDSQNDRIQKFDSEGNYITSWGESGTGEGHLIDPDDIAVDKNGFVYVVDGYTDNESYRIQIFKPIQNLQPADSNKSSASLSSSNIQSDKIIKKNPKPVVKVSEILKFKGENYNEIPESENTNIDSFTISLWFNTNHDAGKNWKSMRDNYDFLLNKGGIGSDKPGYNLVYGVFVTYENKISGGFETINGEDYYVNSLETYNDGEWHNTVLTFDDKLHMLKLYVDGKEISNNPTKAGVKPDITGNGPIRLGANSLVHGGKVTDYYTGQLDDIQIWDNAFTKEQVVNLFDIESNIDR